MTSASVTDQEEVSPKPRPPPKPRPWSLVGVDRKSGEYTVVEGGGVTPPQPDPGEVEEVEDDDEEEKGGSSEGRRGSLVTSQRGSVSSSCPSLKKDKCWILHSRDLNCPPKLIIYVWFSCPFLFLSKWVCYVIVLLPAGPSPAAFFSAAPPSPA